MRKLFLISILFIASPVYATIALVQHPSPLSQAANTTGSLAFASNPTANDLLVVCARLGNANPSPTSITISDTPTNTWTQIGSTVTTASQFNLLCWYAVNSTTGADTVTVSWTNSQTLRMMEYEYSGTATSSPLDTNASGTGSSTGINSSSSINPAGPNELLFVAACNNANVTYTAGTNYTLEDQIPAGSSGKMGTEQWIQTTATSDNGPFTISPSDSWGTILAAFKPAGTATPYKPPVVL